MSYYNTANYTPFATDQEALAWAYASSQGAPQSHTYSSTTTPGSSHVGGGHHGLVQIVLEPAEAQSEYGYGSGQDDSSSDGGRKRACERCRKIKVKCEYPPNVKTCLRCSNVGLNCVPAQPKPRNPRPRLSPYDQVMEGVGSSTTKS